MPPRLNTLLVRTERIRTQRQKDKHKLYALHTPEVKCIGKGSKSYEFFGIKASIAVTHKSGLMIGARIFPGNPDAEHILQEQLEQTHIPCSMQSSAQKTFSIHIKKPSIYFALKVIPFCLLPGAVYADWTSDSQQIITSDTTWHDNVTINTPTTLVPPPSNVNERRSAIINDGSVSLINTTGNDYSDYVTTINMPVNTKGYGALTLMNGATVTLDRLIINDTNYKTPTNRGGGLPFSAIYVRSASSLSIGDNSQIQGEGALYVRDTGSIVTIGNNVTIEGGNGSVGASSLVSSNLGAQITIGDHAAIINDISSVNSSDSRILSRRVGLLASGGDITVGRGATVTVNGLTDNTGVRSTGATSYTSSGPTYYSATTTIGENVTISVNGDKSYGVYSSGDSVVDIANGGNIMATGEQTYGVFTFDGVIRLSGDQTITAVDHSGSKNRALWAQTTNTNLNSSIDLSMGKKLTITGDLVALTTTTASAADKTTHIDVKATAASTFDSDIISNGLGSRIDLDISGGGSSASSSLIGDISVGSSSSSYTNGGIVNLNGTNGFYWQGSSELDNASVDVFNLSLDNNSRWDMTADSQVTALALTGASIVDFQSSQDNHYTLTTGSLSGSGLFHMKVDLATLKGDLLKVMDTPVTGNHQLSIQNVGSPTTNGTEVLAVVSTPDNTQGTFTSNVVEAGAYEYELRQSADGTDWELYGTGAKTSTADASINLFNTNYLLSYIDTQTLLQRMGQLRNTKNYQGDFWIRGFVGKLNSFGSGLVSGFEMDYKGTQVGIDKLINTNTGRLYIGGMVGLTDADPDYRNGSGSVEDYQFGLYGTYITNNDFYIDGVLKFNYFKNHFDVADTLGSRVTGKDSSDGYSASLEMGKRFFLSDIQQTSGYYIEPQVQITYGYQEGMSIYASNGLRANLSNYNYMLGRISALVGYTIQENNPVDVYIKAGYVREFDGKTSYLFNMDNRQHYDFGGGWWESGIGVNAQISERHHIYADINHANGGNFDHEQLNIGYRYTF